MIPGSSFLVPRRCSDMGFCRPSVGGFAEALSCRGSRDKRCRPAADATAAPAFRARKFRTMRGETGDWKRSDVLILPDRWGSFLVHRSPFLEGCSSWIVVPASRSWPLNVVPRFGSSQLCSFETPQLVPILSPGFSRSFLTDQSARAARPAGRAVLHSELGIRTPEFVVTRRPEFR